MLKKLGRFFREYYHLAWVIVATLIAIILTLFGVSKIANFILAITAIISVIPLVWGMIQDIRRGTYGVDILAATAIITSVILGEYWAGIIIVLMLTGGEALEDYAENRAKSELTSLLNRAPTIAHVYKGRKIIDVAVSRVAVGSKILVKPGEVVPVDGHIVEGSSSLDESSLTGESMPVEKSIGDQLLSGSINASSAITYKSTHSAADSQYQQIIKLVKTATKAQSPFVRLADRYSIPFTLVAFIIAGGVWMVSGDPVRFLQVLVVATPCPLILGAPIALISGISRAAREGIIIKNGTAIEQLAAVQTLAFDKTGTLTIGRPIVKSINTAAKKSQKDVVSYAAAVEQKSAHILAKAIVDKAQSMSLRLPKVKTVKETLGHGVSGLVGGKKVLVGKQKLMKDNNFVIPKQLSSTNPNQTISFVAVDGQVIGSIVFEDALRPESHTMLRRIKQYGIKHTLMVTGDNHATAQSIANKLGITDVRADNLPADKIRAIESVAHKPVAFVGDGVNDAPVLTAADVGIALGASGSTAASETADVVIMLDNIERVADGLFIAQNTLKIAKQSILIGISISIVLMLIYATGKFSAASGAVVQEFVDITVILYALRAHGPWKKSSKNLVAQTLKAT